MGTTPDPSADLRAQLAAVEGVSACGGCGGPHRFDTSVPSVLWNRVIRPLDIGEYLCLACIVREFARAGVSFTATLWGDGFDGLPIAVEVNGAASRAAYELNEENNRLRSTLHEVHDRCRAALDDATRAALRATPGGTNG